MSRMIQPHGAEGNTYIVQKNQVFKLRERTFWDIALGRGKKLVKLKRKDHKDLEKFNLEE